MPVGPGRNKGTRGVRGLRCWVLLRFWSGRGRGGREGEYAVLGGGVWVDQKLERQIDMQWGGDYGESIAHSADGFVDSVCSGSYSTAV